MMIFMSGYNEGKAVDWCNSCTTSAWSSASMVYTNTHCSSCESVINYQFRRNTCNNYYEFKIDKIIMPEACYSTCGADPYTEALYFLLIKTAKQLYHADDDVDFPLYKHTPFLMSTNSTCWSSRTITRDGLAPIIDTNVIGLPYIVDHTSNPYSGTFTPNTSSATLSPTSGTFPTITESTNPFNLSYTFVVSEPCGISCCSFFYVVQKNPEHNGQTLDVFLAGMPGAFENYNTNCDSSTSYQYLSPCSFKCSSNTLFSPWLGPLYKQNINLDINNIDKLKLKEASIAPNPATNELKVDINNKIEDGKLYICSLNGEILNSYKFDGSININISYLTNGSYFYYIRSNQDFISFGKFNVAR